MIGRSLAAQWAATAYVAAVSLALLFALARVLGPEGFGAYSYVLTLASLLAIAQDGGFRTLLFREGTSATPRLAAHGADLARLATGHLVVATAAILLLAAVLAPSMELVAAVVAFALLTLAQFASARLKAHGEFTREAGWQVAVRTAGAAAIALVLFAGPAHPTAIFTAWGASLAALLLVAPAGREALQAPRWTFAREVYRSCFAFVVIDAATTLYFRIDVVMLRRITGDDAVVGQYSVAYRLFEAAILLATPVAQLCFRYLRQRREQREAFRRALAAMLAAMAGASAMVVALGVAIGPALVDLAFGRGYEPAHRLLPWLLASLFCALPNYVLTQAAIALNKEAFYAAAACAAAVLNVGLNAWLIPAHGALGAAWATLATEAFLVLVLAGGMKAWLAPAKA